MGPSLILNTVSPSTDQWTSVGNVPLVTAAELPLPEAMLCSPGCRSRILQALGIDTLSPLQTSAWAKEKVSRREIVSGKRIQGAAIRLKRPSKSKRVGQGLWRKVTSNNTAVWMSLKQFYRFHRNSMCELPLRDFGRWRAGTGTLPSRGLALQITNYIGHRADIFFPEQKPRGLWQDILFPQCRRPQEESISLILPHILCLQSLVS